MEKATIHVNGMSCDHCVKAITTALGALPGVSGVSVDLKGKTVTVNYDPSGISLDKIMSEIEEQGYDVVV